MLFEKRILDAQYIDLLEGDERMIVKRSLRWVFYAGIVVGITLIAMVWAIAQIIMMVI